ncbi:hypothetical protein ACFOPX_03455 [Helicobacter baculiformis]|uniref:Uncharacterized protein n=1 Tax=Helicobacter baculiformis TaxID=427351 RepID=A0ABV7ZGC2_9HELI|nr:hypothetical protein [Helicobacter baculiformis]
MPSLEPLDLTPEEDATLEAWEAYHLEQAAQPVLSANGACQPDRWYALLEKNKVVDIFKGDTLPLYSPAHLHVVLLPEGLERAYDVGCALEHGVLQPLSLAKLKERQLYYVNRAFSADCARLHEEQVPFEEALSYDRQYQDARVVGTEPTIFLDALAQARGEDRHALAQKILSKHEVFLKKLAQMIGARQKVRNAIAQAKTLQEILALTYTSPLDAPSPHTPE